MWSASIVGASGYAGGELLRLLLGHRDISIQQATSESFAGKPLTRAHPHLRGLTALRFEPLESLRPVDVLFCCLPHGAAAEKWSSLAPKAERILDLSADFRRDPNFVYGIPELHRDAVREARWVAGAGCNATAAILGLFPLFRAGLAEEERTVVEVKAGSSEAGRKATSSSHHPERSGSVRSYAPTGHRHTAEIERALANGHPVRVHLSLTAVEMVRGAVATSHVFPKRPLTEKEIWNVYREAYRGEPFVRIVKEKNGHHRYPDPRLLAGTNFADVGFEIDEESGRVVVMSAIDNLMKGAAGQAVQCMNLMLGLDERTGLEFSGLHPL